MVPVIFVTAAILGQCGGGRCPAPARIAPSYPAPIVVDRPIYPPPPARLVEPPAGPPLRRHAIRHEGLRFTVLGVRMADGTIEWDPDLEPNARAYEAARAGALAARDAPPKARPPAPRHAIQNFGLAPDKMGHNPDAYTAPSAEAQRFVQEAKGEAGEPGKLHVTVIGSADDCAPVVNDLRSHPALAGVRDRLMVQDYRPSEWPVSPSLGFRVNGRPTILVQTARGPGDPKGGRVVHRQMDYGGGPERLAEAIRKADPGYNPDLDPGPSRPGPLDGSGLQLGPAALVASFFILGVILLIPNKRSPRP